MTGEVIEFFTKYDFRSLVPKEHIETKDFSTLQLKQIPVLGETEIQKCHKLLNEKKKISLATYGERFTLAGGSLYFGGDEIYVFSLETGLQNETGLRTLFQEIISGKFQVIGYDLKKDLERIEVYLEGNTSETTSSQMGLF